MLYSKEESQKYNVSYNNWALSVTIFIELANFSLTQVFKLVKL